MSRAEWRSYLATSPTYGTFEDRSREYEVVADVLYDMGLADGNMILDVGAGSCDLDHYLRTVAGWRGQYVPVDGAIDGINLEGWEPHRGLETDWVVSIETIEHVKNPDRLLKAMLLVPARGFVITTPNAGTHDVRATDPTHQSAVLPVWFESRGFEVDTVDFNGRGNDDAGDTIIASLARPRVTEADELDAEISMLNQAFADKPSGKIIERIERLKAQRYGAQNV